MEEGGRRGFARRGEARGVGEEGDETWKPVPWALLEPRKNDFFPTWKRHG